MCSMQRRGVFGVQSGIRVQDERGSESKESAATAKGRYPPAGVGAASSGDGSRRVRGYSERRLLKK